MISENPRMALSGVRSSWLMLARNSDLARLAASATGAGLFGIAQRRIEFAGDRGEVGRLFLQTVAGLEDLLLAMLLLAAVEDDADEKAPAGGAELVQREIGREQAAVAGTPDDL